MSPRDLNLTYLALAAAVVVLLLFLFWARRGLRVRRLPYYAQGHLLSKGELAFFRTLAGAVPVGLLVSMKVRLCDVIGCTAEGWRQGFGAKIARKHLDFVLIDATTSAIRLVIELDDRTHDTPARQERDRFVDEALATAGVPILHVRAAKDYDLRELAKGIAEQLRGVR